MYELVVRRVRSSGKENDNMQPCVFLGGERIAYKENALLSHPPVTLWIKTTWNRRTFFSWVQTRLQRLNSIELLLS